MRLLLIHLRDGKYFTGDKLSEIFSQIPGFKYDNEKRQLTLEGHPGNTNYSADLTPDDLQRFIRADSLKLLNQLGWKLYIEKV